MVMSFEAGSETSSIFVPKGTDLIFSDFGLLVLRMFRPLGARTKRVFWERAEPARLVISSKAVRVAKIGFIEQSPLIFPEKEIQLQFGGS